MANLYASILLCFDSCAVYSLACQKYATFITWVMGVMHEGYDVRRDSTMGVTPTTIMSQPEEPFDLGLGQPLSCVSNYKLYRLNAYTHNDHS